VDRVLFPTPPNPDPDSEGLQLIADDPIFHHPPPPGTTYHEVLLFAARVKDLGFQGKHWEGGKAELRVTSDAPVRCVHEYFEDHASADGWVVKHVQNQGFVTGWEKTYPTGHAGHLFLYRMGDHRQLSGPHDYELRGHVPAWRAGGGQVARGAEAGESGE
jgi:hypothetical protein